MALAGLAAPWAFPKMGQVSEDCDEEAGDWKDPSTSDQLSQRICALNRWLSLCLFSLTLVPRVSSPARNPYLDAMVRALLQSHIPMIVAEPRYSPAWNLPSIRRLRRQFFEITCEEEMMIVLTSSVTMADLVGRRSRRSFSRLLSSVCQAPKQTKFVNLWMEAQAIYNNEDSGCMHAVPDV